MSKAACNKIAQDSTPDELKELKKIRLLVFRRILSKKIVIKQGKGEFSQIKGIICKNMEYFIMTSTLQ